MGKNKSLRKYLLILYSMPFVIRKILSIFLKFLIPMCQKVIMSLDTNQINGMDLQIYLRQKVKLHF